MSDLPGVCRKFLRYVRIDTQSDPDSATVPSTEKQKDLARMLVAELTAIGVQDAEMDEFGYVFATLPATVRAPDGSALPTVALLAHMDTAPDAPGAGVNPLVHRAWDGKPIALPADPAIVIDPARQPELLRHVGEDLITGDGSTLLGSDDKAGVAVLMQLAELLVDDPAPRPRIRLCFTIDEEIGRGVDHLDLERLGADVAYTVDGSNIDTFSYETFNAAIAIVTIEGVSVHPGYARGVMVNALRIAADLITGLPASEAPETTDGRDGYIHPHRMTESDPSRARVEIILRDFETVGLDSRLERVGHVVGRLRESYPGATITLETRHQYRNMKSYIEDVDPRTVTFAIAAGREMGIELLCEPVRGGTDGSRLSELGLPTPNVFNGGMDYHSRFEWNTVQNLERSLAYVRQLVTYWGLHGHESDSAETAT